MRAATPELPNGDENEGSEPGSQPRKNASGGSPSWAALPWWCGLCKQPRTVPSLAQRGTSIPATCPQSQAQDKGENGLTDTVV